MFGIICIDEFTFKFVFLIDTFVLSNVFDFVSRFGQNHQLNTLKRSKPASLI